MIKGDDALTEISPFEAKWDEQKININTTFRQPVEMKIMKIRMYQSKLIKNLFLSHGYEHVFSLSKWNTLHIDTKILLSQTTYRDIFSI